MKVAIEDRIIQKQEEADNRYKRIMENIHRKSKEKQRKR
jgi:hypothetical protein